MAEHAAEKYATKLLGENDIDVVLQRLDRLTVKESKMTVQHIHYVICGLFNSMQVVMDGAHCLIIYSYWPTRYETPIWQVA